MEERAAGVRRAGRGVELGQRVGDREVAQGDLGQRPVRAEREREEMALVHVAARGRDAGIAALDDATAAPAGEHAHVLHAVDARS